MHAFTGPGGDLDIIYDAKYNFGYNMIMVRYFLKILFVIVMYGDSSQFYFRLSELSRDHVVT